MTRVVLALAAACTEQAPFVASGRGLLWPSREFRTRRLKFGRYGGNHLRYLGCVTAADSELCAHKSQ